MRKYSLVILLTLVTILSCVKTEQQLASEKEKIKKLIPQADKLFVKNDFKKALDLYLEIHKINSKDPVILYKIGFCYDKGEKDIEEAEKFYLRAQKKLDVKNHKKELASVYFNLGLIASKKQDLGKKFEYYNAAFSILENMLHSGDADGEDLFRIAYYYMDKNKTDTAIKFFNKASKLLKKQNPNHFYYAGSFFNIGIIYWNQEDVNTALWYWRRALVIDPGNELYQMWVKKATQIKEAGGI